MFTVEPDPDGIFRRVPLVMMVEEKIRLALSAEMLRIATGGQAFATRTGDAGLEGIVVGGVFVPTDGNGRVWPWFNARRGTATSSAGSVLSGEAPAASIAGQMVVVGTSAVGLEDFRATPVAAFMPGVEIHAQIIENVLTQQFLHRPALCHRHGTRLHLARRPLHHLAGAACLAAFTRSATKARSISATETPPSACTMPTVVESSAPLRT